MMYVLCVSTVPFRAQGGPCRVLLRRGGGLSLGRPVRVCMCVCICMCMYVCMKY